MTILIIIAIIIAIPLLAAAFMSNEYIIEREIVINKPKEEVFNHIKLLRNQSVYNKWLMVDPNVRMEYTGTDGTVGFVAAWDSDIKNVGKGTQEITFVIDGQRIDMSLHFIKPFEGHATTFLITEELPDGKTKILWVLTGLRNYPNKMMHLLFNLTKMLGKDLETSLNNLKTVLEK